MPLILLLLAWPAVILAATIATGGLHPHLLLGADPGMAPRWMPTGSSSGIAMLESWETTPDRGPRLDKAWSRAEGVFMRQALADWDWAGDHVSADQLWRFYDHHRSLSEAARLKRFAGAKADLDAALDDVHRARADGDNLAMIGALDAARQAGDDMEANSAPTGLC